MESGSASIMGIFGLEQDGHLAIMQFHLGLLFSLDLLHVIELSVSLQSLESMNGLLFKYETYLWKECSFDRLLRVVVEEIESCLRQQSLRNLIKEVCTILIMVHTSQPHNCFCAKVIGLS